MEGKCYCCRKGGQCRYKSSPKEEWAINNSKTEEVVSFVQLQDGQQSTSTQSFAILKIPMKY